jgi:hypothetical protein
LLLLFLVAQKGKKFSVSKVLDEFWMIQINTQDGLSMDQIAQFSKLWNDAICAIRTPQTRYDFLEALQWWMLLV